jgi:hypothetical protein
MRCSEAQILLAPLRGEFARRYYLWCLEQSRRELEADFPSIRAIKSHVAFLFLDFAETCSQEELRTLMVDGIKRFNPRATELTNDYITPDEEAIRSRFVAFFQDEVILHGQRLSRMRIPTRKAEIWERELASKTSTQIKSKQLKRTLLETFDPIWGKPERTHSLGLHFSKPFGSWHVTTALDLAGNAQLNYGHRICARRRIDLCPTDLNPSICPMSWCGIHRGTAFDLIQTSEVQEIAETVARFSSRVLEVVPALLSELEHQLSEEIEDVPQIPLPVR